MAALAALARPRVAAYLTENKLVPSTAQAITTPGSANKEGIAANTESGSGAPPKLERGKPREYGGEASINSLMAQRATRAVIIADSSKIGRTAFATLGAQGLTTLITDSGITADQHAAFVDQGYQVIVA